MRAPRFISELFVQAPFSSRIGALASSQKVEALTSDSRNVRPGTLFFAIRGKSGDGHTFVGQVLESGAVAAVVEDGFVPPPGVDPGRLIHVQEVRLALAWAAAEAWGHPSRQLKMFGVTGTSGKTTTSFLLESVVKQAFGRVGLIGTVVFRMDGQELPSTHTTPGPLELQELLANMLDRGCRAVVMEVSSHALDQHRAAFVAWDGVVFTNLSPEHLDYHPDMEHYFQSKARLFTELAARSVQAGKKPVAAIHVADSWGQRLLEQAREQAKTSPGYRAFSFSRAGDSEFSGRDLKIEVSGIHGIVNQLAIHSKLTGDFNAENILGAACVAQAASVPKDAIERGIAALAGVPGRLERVEDPARGRQIFVDYAHKPDALEKVLQALRRLDAKARLTVVFGCGGDRDREKRPKMGEIATRLADQVVITSDNPRTEDPDSIIRMILAGVPQGGSVHVESDRRAAIGWAISQAQSGEIVLIAGKGHETYQIIGNRQLEFDDRVVAGAFLS